MNTNDVLRRLRYAFDLNDKGVVALVALGGVETPPEEIYQYTRPEEDEDFILCPPEVLGAFLDGLVIERRGPPKPGSPPPGSTELTTNSVLRRVRIALILKDTDILEMLAAGGHPMSKSELSALFRRPDHRHYRECGHQALRKFLRGLTLKLRPDATDSPPVG